ncbi:hypothetical protein BN903_16 [Halorubrum sp. AJ67]|nr:hypothetical protein BN903_16 [Halorubrum sp. AJ67]
MPVGPASVSLSIRRRYLSRSGVGISLDPASMPPQSRRVRKRKPEEYNRFMAVDGVLEIVLE